MKQIGLRLDEKDIAELDCLRGDVPREVFLRGLIRGHLPGASGERRPASDQESGPASAGTIEQASDAPNKKSLRDVLDDDSVAETPLPKIARRT